MLYAFVVFYLTFTFQRFDKQWSQVLSLPPAGTRLILSLRAFNIPSTGRCSSNFGNSRSRAIRESMFAHNKNTYEYEYALGGARTSEIYIYIYISSGHSFWGGFGQELFFVSASVCDSRNWNFPSNSFVRAPFSGGGSNAPRPAVSVPHLDVNADG